MKKIGDGIVGKVIKKLDLIPSNGILTIQNEANMTNVKEFEEEVVAEEVEVSISSSESFEANSSTSEEITPKGRNIIATLWMKDYLSKENFLNIRLPLKKLFY